MKNSNNNTFTTNLPRATLNIFLADDDKDDQFLFDYVLKSLKIPYQLTIATDGTDLMHRLLTKTHALPEVLFLDLNMPKKNGFECLSEIKGDPLLKTIPVIICSTAQNNANTQWLYNEGAQFFMQKPDQLNLFKSMVRHALLLTRKLEGTQPKFTDFIIHETAPFLS